MKTTWSVWTCVRPFLFTGALFGSVAIANARPNAAPPQPYRLIALTGIPIEVHRNASPAVEQAPPTPAPRPRSNPTVQAPVTTQPIAPSTAQPAPTPTVTVTPPATTTPSTTTTTTTTPTTPTTPPAAATPPGTTTEPPRSPTPPGFPFGPPEGSYAPAGPPVSAPEPGFKSTPTP